MKSEKMKHFTTTSLAVALVALALLLVASAALAQTGNGYDLSWSTVDGGGGESSGGSYTLMGTAGQPDAGPLLSGGGYTLTGGFWPGAMSGGGKIHLPVILRRG
jgi:hypothetical protein